MRHKTTYKSFIAVTLAALTLAGCQRESLELAGTAIKYKVAVADIATKGTLVNNNENRDYSDIALAEALSPFRAAAYNGTTAVFDTEGLDPAGVETVEYTSGVWKTQNTYYWPQKTVLTFFAYGNLPAGSSVAITSAGQTLTHTMVSAVADQKDILLGYYKGRGVAGNTAEIRFQHPLTAVFFKNGDMGDEVVTSITLSGLAASGTVVMDADGIIGDWNVAAYTAASSQSDSEGLTVDGTSNDAIGDPFILIPQNLATNNVKLTVACESGLTLETTIESGEWKAQKTNWYTLNYGSTTNWTLTVTPWGAGASGDISTKDAEYEFEVSKESHTFRNTTAQEITTIDVTSEMLLDDEPIGNVEWTIKSYQIGTSDPVTVGDSTFTAGGLKAETTADGNLQLTADARTSATPGLHDYWLNQNPVRTDNLDWSPEDWSTTYATASEPLDLSKFNFQTESRNNPMTTANCYIIRHAGTYKLPLVYGNAVVGGEVNEQSYFPNVTEGSNRLDKFQNHRGNGITSAFIENNTGCTAADDGCCIVWQDKAFVIKGLEIVGTKTTTYTMDNVRYLQFTVDNSTICQNNAVIAVKDGDGNIMWSWHIWTTNDPALLTPAIPVFNHDNVRYDFLPLSSLGWLDADCYPSRPHVKIVLQQKKSGEEIEITVSQPAVSTAGRGCWYQFGRKDPMCTVDSPNQGTFTKNGGNNGGAGVSLSTAICNPDKFYLEVNSSSNFDWCSTTYYNLWTGKKSKTGTIDQDADMIKTIYDPSPVGYKMPASNAFTGFTTTGGSTTTSAEFNVEGAFASGWTFYTKPGGKAGDGIVYFPVAGYRYYGNGWVYNADSYGYYWSAVPSGVNYGYDLYFSSGSVYPLNNGASRAYGFSVRPVLEK